MFIDHLADVKQEMAGRILADDSCRADAIMHHIRLPEITGWPSSILDSLSACYSRV